MCGIFSLPARLCIPGESLATGAKGFTWAANISVGIGLTALVAAAVFGVMIVSGLTFAVLATLTVPLLIGALAISAVAFSLSYLAFAYRNATVDAMYPHEAKMQYKTV